MFLLFCFTVWVHKTVNRTRSLLTTSCLSLESVFFYRQSWVIVVEKLDSIGSSSDIPENVTRCLAIVLAVYFIYYVIRFCALIVIADMSETCGMNGDNTRITSRQKDRWWDKGRHYTIIIIIIITIVYIWVVDPLMGNTTIE